MKKFLLSLTVAMLFLFIGVEILAQTAAPVASPVAAVVAAPPAQPTFWQKEGGLVGGVSFIVFGLLAVLSCLRLVLAKYDGVEPGQNTPAPDAKLTFLNNACLFLGKISDILMGNPQH